jgi:hypothetical protein
VVMEDDPNASDGRYYLYISNEWAQLSVSAH